MFWIFLLGIISLMVWHPGFRRVMFWISGVIGALTLLSIGAAVGLNYYQTAQKTAQANTDRATQHVVWLKAHPKGCVEFKSADDVDAWLASEGECNGNGTPVSDAIIDQAPIINR